MTRRLSGRLSAPVAIMCVVAMWLGTGAVAVEEDLDAVGSAEWVLTGNLGVHDPTLTLENGVWYLFQTGMGIYRKTSADGREWAAAKPVLDEALSWWARYVPEQKDNDVLAPQVRRYRDQVWLYYAISTFGANASAIGLLSASSLAADRWRDEGLVIASNAGSNYNAIDPDLFIDPASDEPWLVFGSWWSGIKLAKLDSASMKPSGSLLGLAYRENGIEAPTLVSHGGYYHLFVSVGRCCRGIYSTYRIVHGRAEAIRGPYVDRDGADMLEGGGSLLRGNEGRWIGPGGQDVYGTDVIVYHAYDADDEGRPKLRIETLGWDVDGWPTLGTARP